MFTNSSVALVHKERNSNLELYRIIAMLLIVAHHYVVNSGLWTVMQSAPIYDQSLFLCLFGMWGKTCINCFVLITGYFMCKSEITWRKLKKLLFEIYFYSITITSIFILTGYVEPSFHIIFYALVPLQFFGVNFVSCFLIFYLMIPFLNILVRNMNQKQHLQLVGLCLLVYSIIGSIPKIILGVNYVSWFIVLYLIASYVRFYGFPVNFSNRQWGWWLLFSLVLSMASVALLLHFSFLQGRVLPIFWFVSDSHHILAVITALTSFMYFKDLKIKHSQLINAIGGSTFGVLLIHANSDMMRKWLWQDILNNVGQYGTDRIYLHAILSVIVVFIVCILIDRLRIRFVEKPLLENKKLI